MSNIYFESEGTVKPRFSDLQNSEKPPFSENIWVDGNFTT